MARSKKKVSEAEKNHRAELLRKYPYPTSGIACDASCLPAYGSKITDGYFHGRVEWRGVDLATGSVVYQSLVQEQSTVNIGEFLAIVHSLQYLKMIGDFETPVYSDSGIARHWVHNRIMRTNLPLNSATEPALREAEAGLDWLMRNHIYNPVLKWYKRTWGEIPADFGRK